MKYLRWLVWAALAFVLIIFAITNRATVTIDLWPFSITEKPLYLIVLLACVAGFLVGEAFAWLNGRRWRREARQLRRRVEELERDLAARKPTPNATAASNPAPVSPPVPAIAPTQPH